MVQSDRNRLYDASALCVVQDLLPLSVTYDKPVMIHFASVLIDIGRTLDLTSFVDVAKLLPSNNTFRSVINRLSDNYRSKIRTE